MKNQLADYRHDASRTDDPGEQKRIENEIKRLEKEIKDQQRIVDDPEEADQLKDKLTKGEPPPSVVESTIVVQDNSQLISDLIGPSYVLDNNYYFLDWNQAFDGRALGSDATILTICSTGRSLSVVFAQLSRICPGS